MTDYVSEIYVYFHFINCRTKIIKTRNWKLKTCNHFHNILRLFDVLTNFPLSASETMGDYYL